MGNAMTKTYDVEQTVACTGGHASLWKVYNAVSKITGEDVSLHVFKKDDLPRTVDKAVKEQLYEILRREIKNLASIRHPCVLEVLETFEESKSLLAFATERVSFSLASITTTRSHSYAPQAGGAQSGAPGEVLGIPDHSFETYEVIRGIAGLTEALQYIHTVSRCVHMNIAPESIFIAQSGKWKLAGFGFRLAMPADGSSDQVPMWPFFQGGAAGHFEGPSRLHPDLPYAAPEATAPPGSSSVSPRSDLFSLGLVMHQVLKDPPTSQLLSMRRGLDFNPIAHQRLCGQLQSGQLGLKLHELPAEAQQLIVGLLSVTPTARPDCSAVISNPLFQRPDAVLLKGVGDLSSRGVADAATFLTNARNRVPSLPLRVQRDSIAHPCLDAARSDQEGRLWPFVLPVVGDVCGRLDKEDMVPSIQRKFRAGLARTEGPTLGAMMALMDVFLAKCDVAFFREQVVPMACNALQCEDAPATQELALQKVSTPEFGRITSPRLLEEAVLPRVCWLVVKSRHLSNRINALMCLSKTFKHYTISAVLEKLLPTLKFCAEKDQTVAVQLCVLGVYDAVSKSLERPQAIATHILPACTPILMNKEFTEKQFDMVSAKIQGMLDLTVQKRKHELVNGPPPPFPRETTSSL